MFISVPIAIATYVYQIEYRYLLSGLPIIFLLVLIYSPSGWYFIIPKGSEFFTLEEPNWVYGIYISVIFCIIQSITFTISVTIQRYQRKKEWEQYEIYKAKKEEQKLQQNNLNQAAEEKANITEPEV